MKRMATALFAAALAATLPVSASAQGTPPSAADDAAKLTEARAILAIMFPPERREEMFNSILNQMIAQMERVMPSEGTSLGDAGADAMVAKFKTDGRVAVAQVLKTHLPDILEANAKAYTHQFSLDELKQIRAFAETPTGSHYMSRSATLVNDPAYVAATSALGDDVRKVVDVRSAKLRSDLSAYFKAHPDAAKRVDAAMTRTK